METTTGATHRCSATQEVLVADLFLPSVSDLVSHVDARIDAVDGPSYRVPWTTDLARVRHVIDEAVEVAMTTEGPGPGRWASLAHALTKPAGWNQSTAAAIVIGVLDDGFARHRFHIAATGERAVVTYSDALVFLERKAEQTFGWFQQLFWRLEPPTTAQIA
jgi:hypothetical protein